MKVIFNQAIAGVDFHYRKGQVEVLPAAVAQRYLNAGFCSVVEEKKAAKAERAVSKRPQKEQPAKLSNELQYSNPSNFKSFNRTRG